MIKKVIKSNETTSDTVENGEAIKKDSVIEAVTPETESKEEPTAKPRTRKKAVVVEPVGAQQNEEIQEEVALVIELTTFENTEVMKDSDKEKAKKAVSKEKAKKKAKAKKDKQKEKDKEKKKKAKKREKAKKQKAKDKAKAKKKEKAKKKAKSKKKK